MSRLPVSQRFPTDFLANPAALLVRRHLCAAVLYGVRTLAVLSPRERFDALSRVLETDNVEWAITQLTAFELVNNGLTLTNAGTKALVEFEKRGFSAADSSLFSGTDYSTRKRIRVLIAEDHPLVRRDLSRALDQENDIELVGEASSVEAVQIAQDKMPDVVLMDVRMPRHGGIEATKAIKRLHPHIKILMLTVADEEADLFDAIMAGASGYLLKGVSIEQILNAIRSVQRGESVISPALASKLLSEFTTMVYRADEKRPEGLPSLSAREMEVLMLVAKGRNTREVAGELFISENTVKNHVSNILDRMRSNLRKPSDVAIVQREGDTKDSER